MVLDVELEEELDEELLDELELEELELEELELVDEVGWTTFTLGPAAAQTDWARMMSTAPVPMMFGQHGDVGAVHDDAGRADGVDARGRRDRQLLVEDDVEDAGHPDGRAGRRRLGQRRAGRGRRRAPGWSPGRRFRRPYRCWRRPGRRALAEGADGDVGHAGRAGGEAEVVLAGDAAALGGGVDGAQRHDTGQLDADRRGRDRAAGSCWPRPARTRRPARWRLPAMPGGDGASTVPSRVDVMDVPNALPATASTSAWAGLAA